VRIVILSAALLAGCASLSTETKIEEGVWQTLNVVDAVETYRGPVQQPSCFHEQGTYGILPTHPTAAQLSGWTVGFGAVHFGVTALLEEHHANPWVTRLWEMVTITNTGIIVSNNARTLAHPVCTK